MFEEGKISDFYKTQHAVVSTQLENEQGHAFLYGKPQIHDISPGATHQLPPKKDSSALASDHRCTWINMTPINIKGVQQFELRERQPLDGRFRCLPPFISGCLIRTSRGRRFSRLKASGFIKEPSNSSESNDISIIEDQTSLHRLSGLGCLAGYLLKHTLCYVQSQVDRR